MLKIREKEATAPGIPDKGGIRKWLVRFFKQNRRNNWKMSSEFLGDKL